MKKILGGLLLVVGVCVAIVMIYFASGKTLQITVPKAEVESRIKEAFPITRSMVKMDLDNPQVEFSAVDNRIYMTGDLHLEVMKGLIKAQGKGKISGCPLYNQTLHAFQFQDVKVEELDLNGLSDQMHDQVMSAINKGMVSFWREHPFYQFSQKKLIPKFIGDHIRSVEIKGEQLVLTIGW